VHGLRTTDVRPESESGTGNTRRCTAGVRHRQRHDQLEVGTGNAMTNFQLRARADALRKALPKALRDAPRDFRAFVVNAPTFSGFVAQGALTALGTWQGLGNLGDRIRGAFKPLEVSNATIAALDESQTAVSFRETLGSVRVTLGSFAEVTNATIAALDESKTACAFRETLGSFRLVVYFFCAFLVCLMVCCIGVLCAVGIKSFRQGDEAGRDNHVVRGGDVRRDAAPQAPRPTSAAAADVRHGSAPTSPPSSDTSPVASPSGDEGNLGVVPAGDARECS